MFRSRFGNKSKMHNEVNEAATDQSEVINLSSCYLGWGPNNPTTTI